MTKPAVQVPRQPDQVSAVPFRRAGSRLQFCLITSIGSRRWGFPKGLIDPGETLVETALKEAREEAGLHGRIVDVPLGHYHYHKWGRDLSVVVVLMEVRRTARAWDEQDVRDRRWVGAGSAARLLANSPLQSFLALALERLAGDRKTM